jgi:hypothetical protein
VQLPWTAGASLIFVAKEIIHPQVYYRRTTKEEANSYHCPFEGLLLAIVDFVVRLLMSQCFAPTLFYIYILQLFHCSDTFLPPKKQFQ